MISQVLLKISNEARVVNYSRLFFTVMVFFIHLKMKITSSVRVSTEHEQQQHLHFCTTGEGVKKHNIPPPPIKLIREMLEVGNEEIHIH